MAIFEPRSSNVLHVPTVPQTLPEEVFFLIRKVLPSGDS